MAEKSKTISGALNRIPNLEHNNREHIPPNVFPERSYRNKIFVDGTKEVTVQQVYEKLFEESYQKWREKEIAKSRGDRCPPTYYEKILKDKQKHLLYEIIWQIGDMNDTGFMEAPSDAKRAEEMMFILAEYLMELPNIAIVTDKEINDPDWSPPFEAGIIIQNLVYHGDENSPHIHMTFIPYARGLGRGQDIQNAFAKAFEGMGYSTKMEQAVDEADNLVWQESKDGTKVPQLKKSEYGAVGWIEEIKDDIAATMKARYGWNRFFKGKNKRGNLMLSDYRRERAAERAKEAERSLETIESELALTDQKLSKKQLEAIGLEKTIQELEYLKKLDESEIEYAEAKHKELQNIMDKTTQELTDKEKLVEVYKEDLKRYESKTDEAKADYDSILKNTNEAITMARKAEEVYEMYAGFNSSDREKEMFEEIVQLRFENDKKDDEIKTLRYKLNQAYDFMKQFTLGGINMLEKFFQSIGERVQQMVAGRGR